MALLKKTKHVNSKGADVDSNNQPQQKDLPIDELVCLYAGEHKGAEGFICRLTDGTKIFLPTPNEADKVAIWDALTEAVADCLDFVLYLDIIIRVNLLRYTEIRTVGVPNPTIVFHFEDAFKFHLPYENLELLNSHYATLIEILSRLQDYRSQVPVKKIVH